MLITCLDPLREGPIFMYGFYGSTGHAHHKTERIFSVAPTVPKILATELTLVAWACPGMAKKADLGHFQGHFVVFPWIQYQNV